MPRLLKAVKIVLINVAVLVVLLALAEGVASLLFTANRIRRTVSLSEQHYSRYDETLGWVSLPNVDMPNLYGPGVNLRTNAQGFRGDYDIARAVPPGKKRIVCSGDSFTLGFGVSNAEAWCQRLGTLDPRLETVNMGQGGYGLDQAYLWYMRAGTVLDHQIHLVAFITDDFRRMQSDEFIGFGKPMLGLRNDSVVVLNRPVPRTSAFTKWMAVKGHALTNLNIIQLAKKLSGRDPESSAPANSDARDQNTRAVAARVFETLARVDREKHSLLVLVYLPGLNDYRKNDLATSWRRFVQVEAARQGIPFIDLVDALRAVPPTEVDGLFMWDSHYSAAGNAFVATAVYKALVAMPALGPAN
jgi:hypothetical protein